MDKTAIKIALTSSLITINLLSNTIEVNAGHTNHANHSNAIIAGDELIHIDISNNLITEMAKALEIDGKISHLDSKFDVIVDELSFYERQSLTSAIDKEKWLMNKFNIDTNQLNQGNTTVNINDTEVIIKDSQLVYPNEVGTIEATLEGKTVSAVHANHYNLIDKNSGSS